MNAAIYQCNILIHDTYNFQGVCKVSIQYVKGNYSYDSERNDGSKETWKITLRMCVNLSLDSLSLLKFITLLYTFDIWR